MVFQSLSTLLTKHEHFYQSQTQRKVRKLTGRTFRCIQELPSLSYFQQLYLIQNQEFLSHFLVKRLAFLMIFLLCTITLQYRRFCFLFFRFFQAKKLSLRYLLVAQCIDVLSPIEVWYRILMIYRRLGIILSFFGLPYHLNL